MDEFATEYRAKTLSQWVGACVSGGMTLGCLYGLLCLTHLIGDQAPKPWRGDAAAAVVIALMTAMVLPRCALSLYQALGRRKPVIQICREGLEVRLVGWNSLENVAHLPEWISYVWSVLSFQGFRTRRLRLMWADLEKPRLTGRASVRVLVLRGRFWKAGEEGDPRNSPAADYARFDQQDFAVPMDDIATAVVRFQENEKQRGFLPGWSERT
jgi:hypothetical protein